MFWRFYLDCIFNYYTKQQKSILQCECTNTPIIPHFENEKSGFAEFDEFSAILGR